jgi:hypothetical protein
MGYERPRLIEVGGEITRCLEARDQASALRLAFRFVEIFERAPSDERPGLVAERPLSTGDARFDALLGAVAEYVCACIQLVPPSWVDDESRFLMEWWFVSEISSLHADAIAHSPISFARRGIFITADALTYA